MIKILQYSKDYTIKLKTTELIRSFAIKIYLSIFN